MHVVAKRARPIEARPDCKSLRGFAGVGPSCFICRHHRHGHSRNAITINSGDFCFARSLAANDPAWRRFQLRLMSPRRGIRNNSGSATISVAIGCASSLTKSWCFLGATPAAKSTRRCRNHRLCRTLTRPSPGGHRVSASQSVRHRPPSMCERLGSRARMPLRW